MQAKKNRGTSYGSASRFNDNTFNKYCAGIFYYNNDTNKLVLAVQYSYTEMCSRK